MKFKTINEKELVRYAYERLLACCVSDEVEINKFKAADFDPDTYKWLEERLKLYDKQARELNDWLLDNNKGE